MGYRVTSPGWTGGGALAQSTPVVLLTPSLLAQINATYASVPGFGWKSCSITGTTATFYYGPGYGTYPITGTMQVQVDTLGAAIVGMSVLIATGLGAGWTQGLVVADGTVQLVSGFAAPLLSSLRAVAPLVGYGSSASGADGTAYSIAGRSADAAHIAWTSAGQVQFFTSATMTTLGACAPGSLAVVETAPTNPQSDGGGWRVLSV